MRTFSVFTVLFTLFALAALTTPADAGCKAGRVGLFAKLRDHRHLAAAHREHNAVMRGVRNGSLKLAPMPMSEKIQAPKGAAPMPKVAPKAAPMAMMQGGCANGQCSTAQGGGLFARFRR